MIRASVFSARARGMACVTPRQHAQGHFDAILGEIGLYLHFREACDLGRSVALVELPPQPDARADREVDKLAGPAAVKTLVVIAHDPKKRGPPVALRRLMHALDHAAFGRGDGGEDVGLFRQPPVA